MRRRRENTDAVSANLPEAMQGSKLCRVIGRVQRVQLKGLILKQLFLIIVHSSILFQSVCLVMPEHKVPT